MPIEKSAFSKKIEYYEKALNTLKSLANQTQLPDTLRDKILALQKNFESYDMKQHQDAFISLKGNILTIDDVKKMVLDASGYFKWSGQTKKKEIKSQAKWIRNEYNVDVTEDNVQCYHLEREVSNRSEIFYLEFTCVPGHVYVFLHTGRVSCGSQVLLENKALKKYLKNEFEN